MENNPKSLDPSRLHHNLLVLVGSISTKVERRESEKAGYYASFIISSDRRKKGQMPERLKVRVSIFGPAGEAALVELHQGDVVCARGRLYIARKTVQHPVLGSTEAIVVGMASAIVVPLSRYRVPHDCVVIRKDEYDRLMAFEREELEIPVEKQVQLGLEQDRKGRWYDKNRPYVEDAYGKPL